MADHDPQGLLTGGANRAHVIPMLPGRRVAGIVIDEFIQMPRDHLPDAFGDIVGIPRTRPRPKAREILPQSDCDSLPARASPSMNRSAAETEYSERSWIFTPERRTASVSGRRTGLLFCHYHQAIDRRSEIDPISVTATARKSSTNASG